MTFVRPWSAAVVVAAALFTAGCLVREAGKPPAPSATPAPTPSPAPAPTPPPAPAPSAGTSTVVMREFAFEPKEIRIKAGRVRFETRNVGTVEHDFLVMGTGQHAHEQHKTKPGATIVQEIDLKPGTYRVECTVPGHKEAGMVGTVIAEP